MEGLSTLRNACMGGLLNFLTYCIVRSYVLKPRIKKKERSWLCPGYGLQWAHFYLNRHIATASVSLVYMWCSLGLKPYCIWRVWRTEKSILLLLLKLSRSLCWALHKSQENKRKHLQGCFLSTSFSHLICLLLIPEAECHPNPHTYSQTWWQSHHHCHYHLWTPALVQVETSLRVHIDR